MKELRKIITMVLVIAMICEVVCCNFTGNKAGATVKKEFYICIPNSRLSDKDAKLEYDEERNALRIKGVTYALNTAKESRINEEYEVADGILCHFSTYKSYKIDSLTVPNLIKKYNSLIKKKNGGYMDITIKNSKIVDISKV